MIVLGLICSVFAIAFFCWLLFTLAIYALPLFAGMTVAFAAHAHGAGIGSAALLGLLAGGSTLILGQVALTFTRTPIIRAGIALVFAGPAGVAGYYASLGIAHLLLGVGTLSAAFAGVASVLVFAAAWMRMGIHTPPQRSSSVSRDLVAPDTAPVPKER